MIADRIRQMAADNADRPACRVGAETISYAELWRRAKEVGELLRRQGTSPVVLRGDHCIDEMTALAACLLARRAYVSVGSGVPEGRFREILQATGATLALTLSGAHDDLPLTENVEFLTLSGLAKYRDSEIFPNDNDTAYIIFTSGSTGAPKGVPVSYGNLENFIAWIGGLEPLASYRGANVLNQSALGFDLSVADIYYSLCYGHTWTAVPGGYKDAALSMTQVFRDGDIEVAVMTPSGLKLCLLEETFSAEELPSLRAVFCCGERLEIKTVRKLFARFPDVAMINAYGPTEATCAVCAVRITGQMLDAGEELPVGELAGAATDIEVRDGEIVLRGASVFAGYLDGRTGGHFTEAGANCYRTGDSGCVRDGLLYCTGRRDNQIKYKGYRIETDEIECRILRLPGVAECAVTAPVNAAGIVKTICAHVVAEEGTAITPELIRQGLAETLPAYMIPKTIVMTDRLPRNANGKIDRKALVMV